jgi:CBS-domain-containing membrane protein
MQVRDVMTRNVISVTQGETVVNAARLMLQNSVSGLPVVAADGKLVGIVTEGDPFFGARKSARNASARNGSSFCSVRPGWQRTTCAQPAARSKTS